MNRFYKNVEDDTVDAPKNQIEDVFLPQNISLEEQKHEEAPNPRSFKIPINAMTNFLGLAQRGDGDILIIFAFKNHQEVDLELLDLLKREPSQNKISKTLANKGYMFYAIAFKILHRSSGNFLFQYTKDLLL